VAVTARYYRQDMTLTMRAEEAGPLWGRSLRFVLTGELQQRGTMTVAEMVVFLAERGYDLNGRPSKTISDSLRWEVARGRVIRVRRGVYRYGRPPRTTARRIQLFAQRCDAWIVAVMRSEVPPPTPPTHHDRVQGLLHRLDPLRPPWQDLGWLWTS
jgi:hypothetical protein